MAVTTVATILDRLQQKGVVSRELVREGGPHYLYSAKLIGDGVQTGGCEQCYGNVAS